MSLLAPVHDAEGLSDPGVEVPAAHEPGGRRLVDRREGRGDQTADARLVCQLGDRTVVAELLAGDAERLGRGGGVGVGLEVGIGVGVGCA